MFLNTKRPLGKFIKEAFLNSLGPEYKKFKVSGLPIGQKKPFKAKL